jgi:hypothetical protein
MKYREPWNVIAAGLVGTSAMTLFSYATSWISGNNFSEPVLLGKLLRSTLLTRQSRIALPAGWAAHYAFGCALAAVFCRSWTLIGSKPNTTRALAYGWCSGLAAILWWHAAFRLHPRAQRLARGEFYLHMLIAHLVYSVSTAQTYHSSHIEHTSS